MRIVPTFLFLVMLALMGSAQAENYYIAPNGNDAASGRSENEAWASFDRAWRDLYPGDTLILLDGIYHQSLNPNQRNGEAGRPIYIKAKNDGKAILDGNHQRIPLQIGLFLGGGPVSQFYVVEGLVATNSNDGTCIVYGDNNVLRRVSCYNADSDKNAEVLTVTGNHNLIEDCVASGTGRKMIFSWGGQFNIFRMCFTRWQRYDAREFGSEWPWGENLEFYNSSDSIMENVISYGSGVKSAIGILANINSANGSTPFSRNNRILGAISVRNGIFSDGTIQEWGTTRPKPAIDDTVGEYKQWAHMRMGFGIMLWGEAAEATGNEFGDIFSWGNAGLGFGLVKNSPASTVSGIRIAHATIVNNGVNAAPADGGPQTDIVMEDIALGQMSVVESKVKNAYQNSSGQHLTNPYSGAGARLDYQYLNGVRMDGSKGQPTVPFWPWPMQDRILTELGIDVTGEITEILRSEGVPTGTTIPAPTISPLPPHPVTDLKPGMVEVWYLNPVAVSLSISVTGAVIRYTTDGSEPTSTSPIYEGPLTFTTSTVLKSKVFVGGQGSHTRSALYRIDPARTNAGPRIMVSLLPFVSEHAEIVLPNNTIGLYGLAEDDSIPNPPGKLTTSWTVTRAPAGASVVFAEAGKPRTSVTVDRPGNYAFRLTASDGKMGSSKEVTLVVWPADLNGAAHAIPGKIEAEDYRSGGEGNGFHNTFGYGDVLYRNQPVSPVDVSIAWNDGYGYALTCLAPGEWTAYNVDIRTAGIYTLNLRVAGAEEGGVVHLELDRQDISGPIQIPANGSGTYRLYQTLSTITRSLPAGRHELRLVIDRASVSGSELSAAINYIELLLGGKAPAAPTNLIIRVDKKHP